MRERDKEREKEIISLNNRYLVFQTRRKEVRKRVKERETEGKSERESKGMRVKVDIVLSLSWCRRWVEAE